MPAKLIFLRFFSTTKPSLLIEYCLNNFREFNFFGIASFSPTLVALLLALEFLLFIVPLFNTFHFLHFSFFKLDLNLSWPIFSYPSHINKPSIAICQPSFVQSNKENIKKKLFPSLYQSHLDKTILSGVKIKACAVSTPLNFCKVTNDKGEMIGWDINDSATNTSTLNKNMVIKNSNHEGQNLVIENFNNKSNLELLDSIIYLNSNSQIQDFSNVSVTKQNHKLNDLLTNNDISFQFNNSTFSNNSQKNNIDLLLNKEKKFDSSIEFNQNYGVPNFNNFNSMLDSVSFSDFNVEQSNLNSIIPNPEINYNDTKPPLQMFPNNLTLNSNIMTSCGNQFHLEPYLSVPENSILALSSFTTTPVSSSSYFQNNDLVSRNSSTKHWNILNNSNNVSQKLNSSSTQEDLNTSNNENMDSNNLNRLISAYIDIIKDKPGDKDISSKKQISLQKEFGDFGKENDSYQTPLDQSVVNSTTANNLIKNYSFPFSDKKHQSHKSQFYGSTSNKPFVDSNKSNNYITSQDIVFNSINLDTEMGSYNDSNSNQICNNLRTRLLSHQDNDITRHSSPVSSCGLGSPFPEVGYLSSQDSSSGSASSYNSSSPNINAKIDTNDMRKGFFSHGTELFQAVSKQLVDSTTTQSSNTNNTITDTNNINFNNNYDTVDDTTRSISKSKPQWIQAKPGNTAQDNSGNAYDRNLNFKCPICSSAFKIKGYLTRHLKKHAALKAYHCPYYNPELLSCHRSGEFSRRDTFKTHLKSRHYTYPAKTRLHDRNGKRGWCAMCGEKFTDNEVWLSTHVEAGLCPQLKRPSRPPYTPSLKSRGNNIAMPSHIENPVSLFSALPLGKSSTEFNESYFIPNTVAENKGRSSAEHP